jgi:hypothetical protein
MNRLEKDKYNTYIGLTYSNIQIWGEYERMVDFIFDEFPKTKRRLDEIAHPLLFTISHALELAIKENIKFFRNYTSAKQLTKFDNWALLIKSHDLSLLANEFKIVFHRFHKQVNAAEEDKIEFNKYFHILTSLIEILERNTETYRYSEKLDNQGNKVKLSIKPEKVVDLLEVKVLFDDVKKLLIGAPNVMGEYTDYIDFINNNPDYKKGKGKLYCQRLPYTEFFLNNLKEKLDKDLNRIEDNLWIHPKTYKKYEIEIWNNYIHIIEI